MAHHLRGYGPLGTLWLLGDKGEQELQNTPYAEVHLDVEKIDNNVFHSAHLSRRTPVLRRGV